MVEDSENLRRYVSIALKREGFAVDMAGDGVEALWYAEDGSYDVILLDIMLPELDGLEVLTRLRERGDKSHVLLLTAKDKVEDRVKGLSLGADDYLVKPFDMSELVARVQALMRRKYDQKSPSIEIGDVMVDTVAKKVTVRGEVMKMTSREYLIFEYLVRRRGEIVSRQEIEEHVYDMNADIMSNVINSTISIVRKKLEQYDQRDIITTHRGLGYSIG